VAAGVQSSSTALGPEPCSDPDFRKIDSWIVIHENNTATLYVGKTDPGQGTGTGFHQLMSDELDIAFDRTDCIMGSDDEGFGRARSIAVLKTPAWWSIPKAIVAPSNAERFTV
jgi:CO/xanthine dehydrogenase Mo-binding subunit